MPTLLLVDDNRDYRETTQEVLEMEGYTVVPAENGAVALSLIQQSTPDLILSNGNMPVMTGFELLRAVKADAQLKTIPFVLITGRSDSTDFARSLGADAVLVKPVPTDELLSLLTSLLKR
jgi:CheY-like chemotaxis protein